MNRRALLIGTSVVAIAAFAAAAISYRGEKETVSDLPQQDGVLVRTHSPVIGRPDARVTIVEFLDPSCESCRAFYPYVKQILSDHPNDARLVIRYAPLHEGSDEAVRILEASRLQGKFEDVLQALFRDQQVWADHGRPDLAKAWEIAGGAGLDVAKAKEAATSAEIAKVLQQDIADMKAIDLQGTPTFFVNGKPLVDFGPQQLIDMVAKEVAATKGQAG